MKGVSLERLQRFENSFAKPVLDPGQERLETR